MPPTVPEGGFKTGSIVNYRIIFVVLYCLLCGLIFIAWLMFSPDSFNVPVGNLDWRGWQECLGWHSFAVLVFVHIIYPVGMKISDWAIKDLSDEM